MQNHAEKRGKEISAIPWTNPGEHPRRPLESNPGEVVPKRWPRKAREESWDERRSGEKTVVAVSEAR
jgi:hypothetical protein